MYSHLYGYYKIKYDEHFGQKLERSFVVECLLETKLFKQKTPQSFENAEGFPWVSIAIVETYNGNYAVHDLEIPFVTLVIIVCSKGDEDDQARYVSAFKDVANKLGWRLYLEEDEDGNKNVEIS